MVAVQQLLHNLLGLGATIAQLFEGDAPDALIYSNITLQLGAA